MSIAKCVAMDGTNRQRIDTLNFEFQVEKKREKKHFIFGYLLSFAQVVLNRKATYWIYLRE